MESIRTIEHTINVTSPSLYVSNKETNVKKDLEETFIGKCYGGYYIIKIIDILNMSRCRAINSNQDAICIINVCFNILVRTYMEDDIIPLVKCCFSQGQMCGKGEGSLITFISSPNNNILKKEQIIPVQVGYKIHYNTGSKHINILGSILLPQVTTVTYKLEGNLPSYETFDKYIKLIKEQEDKLKTKQSQHFIELLNTYKNKSKPTGINILELIEKSKKTTIDVTGYWSKDLVADCDQYIFIKDTKSQSEENINITVKEAFLDMLHKCYAKRKGIIDMGISYTDELLKQSENVWTLMKRYKL